MIPINHSDKNLYATEILMRIKDRSIPGDRSKIKLSKGRIFYKLLLAMKGSLVYGNYGRGGYIGRCFEGRSGQVP